MANRIFTNGEEGKILTSVGNRIIKQPYEFGNAFQNRMGLNNYFELSGVSLPTNWCIVTIGYFDTGVEGGVFQAIATSLNLADNLVMRGGLSGINFTSYIGIGYNTTANNNKTIGLRYSYSSQSTVMRWAENTLTIVQTTGTRTEAVRDKIRIGATGAYNANNSTLTYYLPSSWKLNMIAIFDREMSIGELKYFRNNLLYNEFQSTLGLQHLWKLDGVEDIGSLPCLRDKVGTYHMPMMNLPAGTLQQKLDYANTNLFVPFLT